MAIRIRYTLDLNLARAAKRSFCATSGGRFVSRWMGLGQDRDQGGGSLKVKWDTRVTRGDIFFPSVFVKDRVALGTAMHFTPST